ncbi:ABC transporter ATP-binding protein [Pararhizobium haloflavum]|uniref:ABC transporter ATP-binding protein n=1 Tax=Pararhizobium haloflavum TaxID=2037914 RepID=UPI000C1A0C7A|nr:dipeptide ABC transporter ATP-binding protein [Pararhizobium haloflavum]
MSASLSLSAVSLSIQGQPILDHVDLELKKGEVLGLVGESGSGKSMTALAAMQLLPQGASLTGVIELDGQDLTDLDEAALCRLRGGAIGMIFQEPMTALNPLQTIGHQVAETIRIHRGVSRHQSARLAREVLNRVGLPEAHFALDRYPHDLSGGQRQRVVIAIAIACRPKVLIADEPTTALDVTTQAEILALLKHLVAEEQMGLLLITHDLAVVADMADRIAIMKDGRIVEAGETVALFDTMRHPYTRRLFEASRHVPRGERRRAEGEPLLEAEGIVRDYRLPRRAFWHPRRTHRAVDHVSFTLRRGENVGLVGESGCGKSTLARAVLGLESLQEGRITLLGSPFAGRDILPEPAARRDVQVVFQDPYGSFNPRHRVERLIAEPFHLLDRPPHGAVRRARIERALGEVGLAPADASKYIHEFSGGQRQRLAIARALIIEPALIILDEAVSALDVSIRAQILDLLADLSERLGVTYLFISHDLSVVRAITDRVMVMKDGSIVEEGETDEVFARPQHAYTQRLLAATPLIDDALARRRDRTLSR